jgi:NADH:ubiquinone oxidoreductase subunit 6 (subunit J)
VTGIINLLGIDFIAVLYLIIYIGAVLVLFLFVIMLVNIRILVIGQSFNTYVPIATLFVLVSAMLIAILHVSTTIHLTLFTPYNNWALAFFITPNTLLIGRVMYTEQALNIILISVVLLLSLLGAVMLTKIGYDECK